jgi:hypothetical protein
VARAGVSRSVVITAVLAAVATAAALVTVVMLRPKPEDALASAGDPASAPASECGQGPCRVLASASVRGTTVDLLADADGGNGRFRSGGAGSGALIETMLTAMGVRLSADSMRCVSATVSACLLRGTRDGGTLGEVLVSRANDWRSAEKPYFSDAGDITLGNVTGDDSPEVIVVKHECASSGGGRCAFTPVYAEIFDLGGRQVGCTRKYSTASQMRNWPDIRPAATDLRACS